MPTSTKQHDAVQVSPAERRRHERKRRRNEFIFASAAFVVVLLLTSVQINKLHTGDAMFMALFNFNFVLLLAILFVVLRNALKLLLERRRKVLGSRLRTRLVFAFVGFSLLPCALMFLVTTKYVQLSIDFWFKDQIESSMEAALDMARSVYDKTGERLVLQASQLQRETQQMHIVFPSLEASHLLAEKKTSFKLAGAGSLNAHKKKQYWIADAAVSDTWEHNYTQINWQQLDSTGSTFYLAEASQNHLPDILFALVAFPAPHGGYLVLAENMGEGFKAGLDRIGKGKGEYKNLRKLKQPLKRMLYSSLGVLTALIILGAIWYAFKLSREISAPVHALAAGTEAIAQGDFSIRLSDSSSDELGMLIRSFNLMAKDLDRKQQELTGANAMLEKQNNDIAQHSKYIETVLDTITAGVISFDHLGHVATLNKAACHMFATNNMTVTGAHISSIVAFLQAQVVADICHKLQLRPEARIQHSFYLPMKGEDKHILMNVAGVTSDGVLRGGVAVFEDISELERMQRTAAWREVARRIAHEIKNPLTPIKLSAQRLAKKFGPHINDPAFIQSTSLIVQQVEHLLTMVQEFSAFAKLPEVVPTLGAIQPLIEETTTLFRNSHTTIRWEVLLPQDLPEIPMDAKALHRALMNIYTNAAEALLMAKSPNPVVRTTVLQDKELHMLRIDVTDNGPGFSEEERIQLFEPYFTHKKGGTGLGLTIVRSIISDHHGYVRAARHPGGGTVISLELPLT